jgi:MFS family permease
LSLFALLVGLVLGIAGSIVAAELSGWAPRWAEMIIHAAARCAPVEIQERVAEEWLFDMKTWRTGFMQIIFASSLFLAGSSRLGIGGAGTTPFLANLARRAATAALAIIAVTAMVGSVAMLAGMIGIFLAGVVQLVLFLSTRLGPRTLAVIIVAAIVTAINAALYIASRLDRREYEDRANRRRERQLEIAHASALRRSNTTSPSS